MKGKSLVVLLTLLVIGAAALLVCTRSDSPSAGGPLDSGGLGFSLPLEVNEVLSIGLTEIANLGDQAATIERVRLLGVTGPLELVGVRARPYPLGDNGILAAEFGFPPPKFPAEPLSRSGVVPPPKMFSPDGEPSEGVQLVIGIKMTAPGIAAYRDVEVTYRVGKRSYTEVWNGAVHLCAPAADFIGADKDCPPEELEERFEDRTLG